MRTSVDSGYWYGRDFRIYLSTVHFNLQHRRFFAAMSRGIYGMAWFALARQHILSRGFWDGTRAHHAPNTLHFIMKAIESGAKHNAPA
jgi:hypothetical protein